MTSGRQIYAALRWKRDGDGIEKGGRSPITYEVGVYRARVGVLLQRFAGLQWAQGAAAVGASSTLSMFGTVAVESSVSVNPKEDTDPATNRLWAPLTGPGFTFPVLPGAVAGSSILEVGSSQGVGPYATLLLVFEVIGAPITQLSWPITTYAPQ